MGMEKTKQQKNWLRLRMFCNFFGKENINVSGPSKPLKDELFLGKNNMGPWKGTPSCYTGQVKQRWPIVIPPLFFNIVLEILTNSGSQETEIQCLKVGKFRCKNLFAGDMIIYLENSGTSPEKLSHAWIQ